VDLPGDFLVWSSLAYGDQKGACAKNYRVTGDGDSVRGGSTKVSSSPTTTPGETPVADEPVIVVLGETGHGKSTFCNRLLQKPPD